MIGRLYCLKMHIYNEESDYEEPSQSVPRGKKRRHANNSAETEAVPSAAHEKPKNYGTYPQTDELHIDTLGVLALVDDKDLRLTYMYRFDSGSI